ncbi:hypothetical protein AB0A63_31240 [Lentzea sp. NPDC042327]|uniref:hypothetical protein n=1 Tax=Lentzea sp. NPDC042327 TaxID=3154801 RepID=UPI0033D4B877
MTTHQTNLDDTVAELDAPPSTTCTNGVTDGLCGDEQCGHCVIVALTADAQRPNHDDHARPDTATLTPADTAAELDATPAEEKREYPYLLKGVDPQTLIAKDNTRVVGDIRQTRPKLVASVVKHGLLTRVSIINVADEADGLHILNGFHRHAAAVTVKTAENDGLLIDVMVHAPGTSRADVMVGQMIENIHREGYTEPELADAVQMLALEGLDTETIAEELSEPIARIQAAQKVATNTRTRAAGDELPDADLLTLAELAEFEDDPELHQELVEVLRERPGDFVLECNDARKTRERQAKVAEAKREFAAQGYAVLDDVYVDGVEDLSALCDAESGAPITAELHETCPGRAVQVRLTWKGPEVVEYCVNFADHGHCTMESVVVATAEEKLRGEGVVLVDPATEGLVELRHLYPAEGERSFKPEEHASCPGHAAFVYGSYGTSANVRYVCTDFVANGHVITSALPKKETRSPEWLAADRKRTPHNNDLWELAEEKRRAWLKKYFSKWRNGTVNNGLAVKAKGKKAAVDGPPPARLQHWLVRATMEARNVLTDGAPQHVYACQLLGLPQPAGKKRSEHPIMVQLDKKNIGDAQVLLIQLAQVIGACEDYFNIKYTRRSADHTWRVQTEDVRFYFRLLHFLGYPAEHIEQVVLNPELDHAKWPHLAPAAKQNSAEDVDADADEAEIEIDGEHDGVVGVVGEVGDGEPVDMPEVEVDGEHDGEVGAAGEAEVPDDEVTAAVPAE